MLIDLAAIEETSLATVGGKAQNLARLMQLGLPVPPGFCVTGAAYRQHLLAHHLQEEIDATLRRVKRAAPGKREKPLAALRQAVIAAPMAVDLSDSIRERYLGLTGGEETSTLVAVRSSATAEDLPDHSFAGQHDTYLGVAGISECLRAVKDCWASLWTERAFEYRERAGVYHPGVDMAVIVQMLVPADLSGVAFTVEPVTGRTDRLVIEAIPGLGEELVSGRVTPDRVTLSRPHLKVRERGGADSAAVSCLRDGPARRLGRLALVAEKGFGVPLDIEWALLRGKPYLLQARPITNLPEKRSWEERQVWTNANAGEVLPDVASPMTWSMMEPVAHRLLGIAFSRLGMSTEGHTMLGRHGGRAYFNLNTIIAFTRNVPGMRGKSIDELFGGNQDLAASAGEIDIAEEDIPDVRFSLSRAARGLPRMARDFLLLSPMRAARVLGQASRMSLDLEGKDAHAVSDRELVRSIRRSLNELMVSTEIFVTVGLAVAYETGLYDACRRWLGDDGHALASRLLAGMGNNENANAGLDLWRLAAKAQDSPPVEAALLKARSFRTLRRKLAETEAGEEFLLAWEAFMQEHGHHCRGELEVMNPRWSEEPDRLLEQVQSYLRASPEEDFLARYRRLARDRESATAECRRRLWNPLKRLVFEFLLEKSRRYSPIRENVKSRMVRWLAGLRRLLLELGERMVGEGRLKERDDIFFLGLKELEAVVQGTFDADLGETIAARKADHEKNLNLTPPPVIVGRFDPERACETVDDEVSILKGVPANPGVVTGPARVILRSGTETVEPGEILVAPFTDPGWTPYFLNAAAIVMDMGGILSHGSIVAREYGIPAVVNVGPATKVIRTGQEIQVDGARGTVKILTGPSAAGG